MDIDLQFMVVKKDTDDTHTKKDTDDAGSEDEKEASLPQQPKVTIRM